MTKKPNYLSVPMLLASALILNSCGKHENDKPLQSGVILKNMDTLVKPGDNFDAYVNGTWIKNAKIPADKSATGSFDAIYDKSQDDLKAIIEESSKGKFEDGSNEQKIGDFYNSYLNQKDRDTKGVSPLQPEFAKIDAISNYNQLAAFFGEANRKGYEIPFSFSVGQDYKEPNKNVVQTWQGGLALPEREYYLLQDAKSKDTRSKYLVHLTNMMKLANLPNPDVKANEILALETTLAKSQMSKEETRNIAASYNKVETSALKTLMPDFDWAAMMKEAGVDKEKTIIVSQLAYTKALNDIIKSTPLDTWKTYLKWMALHKKATILSSAIDKENFSFYGKTLYGMPEQRTQTKRAVTTVDGNLGEIIGKEYVKRHFPPEAKERMVALVKNLLKAYEESIKKLDWMSPETKKQALEKIAKFNPKIGYPDKWIDYSKLKIVKNDLYGNVARSGEFQYNRQIDKLGKPVDRTEWIMTPQTVNAYYNPNLNEIVFPAAILQPPFFDLNVDDAINYGGIGAVVGHEIGHGFDDQGATFDGDGVMRDWWTPKDLEAFKQKTGALADQYSGFKAFPDLSLNGPYTLGENIGDLGGLTIALKAYQMNLNGKKSPVMDGFSGEQRVFLGWAQVWLDKSREEAVRSQIASDSHSPAHFRINGIVRNIPEFYEAFKVKPGDSLYLAPEKRVKIW